MSATRPTSARASPRRSRTRSAASRACAWPRGRRRSTSARAPSTAARSPAGCTSARCSRAACASRGPPAHRGPARRRADGLPALGRPVRPRAARHLRRPGRDRAGRGGGAAAGADAAQASAPVAARDARGACLRLLPARSEVLRAVRDARRRARDPALLARGRARPGVPAGARGPRRLLVVPLPLPRPQRGEPRERRARQPSGGDARPRVGPGAGLTRSGALPERDATRRRSARSRRPCGSTPGLFEAHYFYARHAFASGQAQKALRLYEEAMRVRPEDYQAPLLAAQIYDDCGRPGDAAGRAPARGGAGPAAARARPRRRAGALHGGERHGGPRRARRRARVGRSVRRALRPTTE